MIALFGRQLPGAISRGLISSGHRDMLRIIDDTNPDLAGPNRSSQAWGNWSKWTERAVFTLVVPGFTWALVMPPILS